MTANNDTYIVPAHVLCSGCQQPIKAWINSPQWIRVEWVSPEGECQACARERKEAERDH